MKLTKARVTNYRSIDDSGWVSLDNVTCMVGKNESGKTAFLGALRRLNPVGGANGNFDIRDYPRKGYVRYKRRHEKEPATAIQAEFELTDQELEEIESRFGQGVLKSRSVIASKSYKNQRSWDVQIDESALVRDVVNSAGLPYEAMQYVENAVDMQDLQGRLQSLDVKPSPVADLLARLPEMFGADLRQQIVLGYLERFLPEFVYFDNYSAMRGRISIQDIKQRRHDPDEIDDADRTFMALLALVGADLDDLEHQMNYEYMKAELESASIGISDEIFEFWKQNTQLRVDFDLSVANPKRSPASGLWNDTPRSHLERQTPGVCPVRRAVKGVRLVLQLLGLLLGD